MDFIVVIGALVFLMFVAYRGYSVIMFAPVAAMLAVLFTDPSLVLPMFSGVFMEKMVGFVKLYFPVFMLGAIFGKVIELSGYSKSIVSAVIHFVGEKRAMLSIVLVCAILTYGGVSLFVLIVGLLYLNWRRRQAAAKGEGYGTNLINEPEPFEEEKLANPWIAII